MRKILFLTLTLFSYYFSYSPYSGFAIEPRLIKTEIGMTIWLSQWNNISTGLVQWPDCRYYQTNINTKFNFNTTTLFSPSIKFIYNKISLCYEYLSNNLPGPIYVSDYEANFKQVDGTQIHPLQGYLKKHKIRFSYDMNKKNFNLFVEGFITKRNISGGYVGTIIVFNPLSGIHVTYKTKCIGFGSNIRRELSLAKFFIFGEIFLAPFTKYSYTYQFSIAGDFRTRKMWGWGGHLQAGIGYHWGSFVAKFGYRPEFYQTYDHSIKDKCNRLGIGIFYIF